MMKTFKMFLALLFVSNCFSQNDSTAYVEEKKEKLKFIFNFDARRSFIGKNRVRYWGIKLGLGNHKHRFGISLHGLQEPVFREVKRPERPEATDSSYFEYGHSSFYYEPIFYRNRRWEFSGPLHLNFGSLRGSFKDTSGTLVPFLDIGTSSLTVSVKGHFKIFRWVGLGFGAGYNQLLGQNKEARKALSQPFYSYGVKIFLGEVWKLMTKKSYRKSEWVD